MARPAVQSVGSAGFWDSSETRVDPDAGREISIASLSQTDSSGLREATAWGMGGRPAPNRWIGDYRLIEPLGAGTQGVVWRAVRAGEESVEVALKLLSWPGRSDRNSLLRLRREAARGARLDHPGILPVTEFGEGDGVAFLAMDLIEGWTLGEVLGMRRRPLEGRAKGEGHPLVGLPEPEYHRAVAAVLMRVGRGLHAAHSARIAHRDVKPSNVLLDRHDSERAVLADFGLGRDLDVATLDQLRDWSGSPLYMAPEKLRGVHEDEILCDVYALGVTLFESLTLCRPFEDPGQLPARAVYWHLARQKPLRPRKACPNLPVTLEAIILGAMDRDPARRTPTAEGVADELANYLDRGPRFPVRRPRPLGHAPRFTEVAWSGSPPMVSPLRPRTSEG